MVPIQSAHFGRTVALERSQISAYARTMMPARLSVKDLVAGGPKVRALLGAVFDTEGRRAYTRYMLDLSRLARKMASACPGFRLRQASRVIAKIYDDALRPVGLQLTQLPVLTALAIFGESGTTMSALAQAVVMDRTTLTRNVRPLEKAGLLRVARSPDDARARVVLLTRSGERVLEAAFPLWESAVKRVRTAMGATGLADLQRRLDEVIAMRLRA